LLSDFAKNLLYLSQILPKFACHLNIAFKIFFNQFIYYNTIYILILDQTHANAKKNQFMVNYTSR